jgi:hypothetical protein
MRKKTSGKAGPAKRADRVSRQVDFHRAEIASRVASPSQKQVRIELLAVGADWWMARSARTAMTALHRSGVKFRRRWKPPSLQSWEGPPVTGKSPERRDRL